MRNQNSFAYPCFSGECGFCSHCCGIPYEYHDSEEMHRADTIQRCSGSQSNDRKTVGAQEAPAVAEEFQPHGFELSQVSVAV